MEKSIDTFTNSFCSVPKQKKKRFMAVSVQYLGSLCRGKAVFSSFIVPRAKDKGKGKTQ